MDVVLLSVLTVITLTSITLTSAEYRSDDVDLNFAGFDDNHNTTETVNVARINPKFHKYEVNINKTHPAANRSSYDLIEYSIVDQNVSQVDKVRQEKVKQVQKIMFQS